MHSARLLPPHPLMLVYDVERIAQTTDGDPRGALPLLAAAVAAGVDLVQLRAGRLDGEALLSLARAVREVTAHQARLLLNCGDVGTLEEVARIACLIGADGLHLAERGPSVASAREALAQATTEVGAPTTAMLIGRSVHSATAARAATDEQVDYLVVGSIFATASHPGREPAGLALLREVRAATSLPLLAIGGLTAVRVLSVRAAGADGIAVIGAILHARGPAEAGAATYALRAALDVPVAEGNTR